MPNPQSLITTPLLILASASPRRLELLKQIGVVPDRIVAAEVDEASRKNEPPQLYAVRLAREKAQAVAGEYPGATVLAADTVVACGRRILPKAEDEQTARKCLDLLSGRRHRVYTAVCMMGKGRMREKCAVTRVMFRRLGEKDIQDYLASGEWKGKAGGYAIQGRAASFIPWINGSYSNVVGLPLSETAALLHADYCHCEGA